MGGVINIVSRSGSGPTGGALWPVGGLGLFRGVAGIGGGVADDRVGYSETIIVLTSRTVCANAAHIGIRADRAWCGSRRVRGCRSPGASGACPRIDLHREPGLHPGDTGRFETRTRGADPAARGSELELFEQKLPFSAGNATYIPQPDRSGREPPVVVLQRHGNASARRLGQDAVPLRPTRLLTHAGATRMARSAPGSFESPSLSTSHFNGRTDTLQGANRSSARRQPFADWRL